MFAGGIRYNLGRVPIGSCDFSTRNYSYDEVHNDFDLKNFSITDDDLFYKVLLENLFWSYLIGRLFIL